MLMSAPNILASFLHHATSKAENCFPCLLYVFLPHRQRGLLLHQTYHFLVVEEEFRIRRRNQRRSMLTFFSQMNQQNTQRRRTRTWLRHVPKTGSAPNIFVFHERFPSTTSVHYHSKYFGGSASGFKNACLCHTVHLEVQKKGTLHFGRCVHFLRQYDEGQYEN